MGRGAGRHGRESRLRDGQAGRDAGGDRKSTRLNSSHGYISYAVFCLKKKKNAIRIRSSRKATRCWPQRLSLLKMRHSVLLCRDPTAPRADKAFQITTPSDKLQHSFTR